MYGTVLKVDFSLFEDVCDGFDDFSNWQDVCDGIAISRGLRSGFLDMFYIFSEIMSYVFVTFKACKTMIQIFYMFLLLMRKINMMILNINI